MINGSSIVTQRKSTLKRKTLNIRFKHWISNTELCIESTGSLFSHKLADLPDFWGLFLILTLLKFVSWDNLFWYVFSFYIKASLPMTKRSLWRENIQPFDQNDSPCRWARTVQTEFLPLAPRPHHAPSMGDTNICFSVKYPCCCAQHEVPGCWTLHSWGHNAWCEVLTVHIPHNLHSKPPKPWQSEVLI